MGFNLTTNDYTDKPAHGEGHELVALLSVL
jgi:hypothetical protein